MSSTPSFKGATKVSEYSAITTECEKISELAENRPKPENLWQKKRDKFSVPNIITLVIEIKAHCNIEWPKPTRLRFSLKAGSFPYTN